MTTQYLFYFVFLSQVLLISLLLPGSVLHRLQHLLDTYPASDYPRLYPIPTADVEKTQGYYRSSNRFALVLGLALVCLGFFPPTDGLVDWENEALLAFYFVIQLSPLLIAATPGFIYFNLKREPDSRTARRAELRPRRLLDFVSLPLISLVIGVYIGFCLFIVYINTFDFPWFGGYLNIVVVSAGNVFFAAVIWHTLRGKKTDPYQGDEDRLRQIERTIKILAATSVLGTVFIAGGIGLHALDWHGVTPVFQSLYLQLLAFTAFQSFRIDNVNFEVYRQEPAST